MFDYIIGKYIGLKKDYIVVENNNIGYKIYTSGSTIAKMPDVNEEVKIYVEQIVREDFIGLYGFFTEEERELFNLLLTISGVGSKAALSLLSISNVNNLRYAIISGDYKTLTKAPGIGKKIAQRIILELADKIGKNAAENGINFETEEEISENKAKNYKVAMEALLSLGFSQNEAEKALKNVDTNNNNVEDIIKSSLRYLTS